MNHRSLKTNPETWVGRESLVARNVARPMLRFLAQETASGVVLVGATVAALLWANSGWSGSYHDFWSAEIEFGLGAWHPLDHGGHPLSLRQFVNDALMAVFFFVVGLEIATEFVAGELRDRRVAALPAIAAVGGMAIPALLYTVFNGAGVGARGWGIPMATDIAFAVGVLALMGSRVPRQLKIFMLTLAIVDDIGAILVIAIFYTDSVSFGWLAAAVVGLSLIAGLRHLRVWYTPIYAVVGLAVWYATFRSGVHATIAGMARGLLVPSIPLPGSRRFEALEDLMSGDSVDPAEVRLAAWRLRESVPVSTRLIGLVSPWTGFVVVPIFALANAGVTLSGDTIADAAASPVTLGVVVGLVLGKPAGVILATLAAKRMGIAVLAPGLTTRHVVGGGAVAGIGFTVALFVAGLSFTNTALTNEAVIGVLAASVIAAAAGVAILATAPANAEPLHDEPVL